jgi:hypothetical protein
MVFGWEVKRLEGDGGDGGVKTPGELRKVTSRGF